MRKNDKIKLLSRPAIRASTARLAIITSLIVALIGLAVGLPSAANASSHAPALVVNSMPGSAHADSPPTVTEQLGSGGRATVRKPPSAEEFSCAYSVTAPMVGYYSRKSPFKLEKVALGAHATLECSGVTAILLSAKLHVTTPHGVTHTVIDKHCYECALLTSSGSYLCDSGTYCAGEWKVKFEGIFALAPGFDFGSASAGCKISGPTNNILTCEYTKTAHFPAHNS